MKRNTDSQSLPCLSVTLAAAALALVGALGQTGFAAEPPALPVERTPLALPGCEICIVGTPTVQWSGASGSFRVDRVENRTPVWTRGLALNVALSTYPDPFDWGSEDPVYSFSDSVSLNQLPPNGSYSNVDSGRIAFHGSKVPAGEYRMFVILSDGGWGSDYVEMSEKVSCDGSNCVVKRTNPPPSNSVTRFLPVVLDVSSSSAHYTTEMALTNNTFSRLDVSLLYTASLGSKEGSGTVTDSLAPGEQKQISDVLSFLREKGLAVPSSAEQPSQGGTLVVTFEGSEPINPKLVSVTATTAALTSAPHPVGRAGLAYSGLLETESSTTSLTLFGLRSTSTERTNVAVFNTSSEPVTLRVTVHSGSGDGRSVVFREAETLPPYGWLQYPSARILDGTEVTRGWVTIERTSGTGSFSAYAVINDSETNDGSYVPPVRGAVAGSTLTVPVYTEAPDFRSELILANKSASDVSLELNWIEDHGYFPVAQAMNIQLGPQEERVIPDVNTFLRANGLPPGTWDDYQSYVPYIGAVWFIVSGTAAENVFAGTRTVSQSPAGGQFGLFAPCVYSGQEASSEAYIYGLRADAENRSNVAVGNTGAYSDGDILLQLQAYDGDTGGAPKGDPLTVGLAPRDFWKIESFFSDSGVANGWVKVTRMSGTAPWFAYGVVYDGGNPGERTGDGAYIPMVK